ncbi:MAG: 2-amino-4-hydroxy-6-hydroxymethyldihydropteridine diphosphokinase, partial [Hyphomicrobiales bacterium]
GPVQLSQCRRGASSMILIAIGSNMEGPWGPPRDTVQHAFAALDAPPLRLARASRPIVTAPYGRTDQPDFVNAVAEIETELEPRTLLAHLLAIERSAGRARTLYWGPRTLDLDLLDYHGLVVENEADEEGRQLVLPHPGIPERSFVLGPIAEIAPHWRHPTLGQTAQTLLERLEAPDRA